MQLKFVLHLPRDARSVFVVRRILTRSLSTLGVTEACTDDIEVALSEACTNVLDHAEDGDDYHVSAGVEDDRCVIEVIDTGRGFDAEQLGHTETAHTAEEGRGIQLIRALVDRVQFSNRPEKGSIVHFEKRLEFVSGAPIAHFMRSDDATDHAEPAVVAERDAAVRLVEALGPDPDAGRR